MYKNKFLRVFLPLFLVLMLAACGASAEDYQVLSEAHAQLEEEAASLQSELEQLQGQLEDTEADRSRWEQDKESQKTQNDELRRDNESLQSKIEVLEQELAVKYQAEAQPVMDSIAAIGDVIPEKEEAITAARQAYEALPETVRKHVTNAQTLTAAETALQEQKNQKAEQERIALQAEQERAVSEAAAASALQAEEEAAGYQVLVTPTGSKYHSYKCGNGTYTWTSLENAQARGLTACKKCF